MYVKGEYVGGEDGVRNKRDLALAKRVLTLMEKFETAQFRFQGRRKGNHEQIRMVFEFIYFLDEAKTVEKTLRALAKEIDASVQHLLDQEYLDHYKPAGSKKWITGKNHGRMERQVEFHFDVTDHDIAQIRALIRKVKAAITPIWSQYGVDVL